MKFSCKKNIIIITTKVWLPILGAMYRCLERQME
jgi:hypothetical protein